MKNVPVTFYINSASTVPASISGLVTLVTLKDIFEPGLFQRELARTLFSWDLFISPSLLDAHFGNYRLRCSCRVPRGTCAKWRACSIWLPLPLRSVDVAQQQPGPKVWGREKQSGWGRQQSRADSDPYNGSKRTAFVYGYQEMAGASISRTVVVIMIWLFLE